MICLPVGRHLSCIARIKYIAESLSQGIGYADQVRGIRAWLFKEIIILLVVLLAQGPKDRADFQDPCQWPQILAEVHSSNNFNSCLSLKLPSVGFVVQHNP